MKTSNHILIPEFERLLKDGHIVDFTPQGVSMRPTIEGGVDSVLLRTCQEPKIGYIVLAKIGEQYVLHRIVNIQGKKITLQGDGNLLQQETCTSKDIIAQVVRIKGYRGAKKRLTKARIWRHLPVLIKKIYLKFYRFFLPIYEN